MNDVFSWLAYSWAVVYEHLTGKFKNRPLINEAGYANDAIILLSYIGVLAQIATVGLILKFVL